LAALFACSSQPLGLRFFWFIMASFRQSPKFLKTLLQFAL
jgi:hypothetical protein